jgi:hypothetical protein
MRGDRGRGDERRRESKPEKTRGGLVLNERNGRRERRGSRSAVWLGIHVYLFSIIDVF